jgi:archaellum component FlaF (FlaF/FlaG flagellin family)
LKALSYWPAEDYLNIWVANLSNGILGYTQLPVSSTLQGLSDSSNDRLTDGVVIHYKAYGTNQATGGSSFNLLSEYALGRTATHEVGHFFGLRHVWGDVTSCDPSVSTDYVSDTPIQNSNFNGLCPSSAQTECGVHSMFDNYMNYTDDACMNIFSQGQAGRMITVINNSPRRLSLLTSQGSQLPAPVANDLGVKAILNPLATTCSGSMIPSITVRNYGANQITSAQIQFLLNGTLVENKSVSPISLNPNDETTVDFSSISLSEGVSYSFSFQVLQTNGGTDGNSNNNALSVSTKVPVTASLPISELFNTMPSGWQISNPDNLATWSNVSAGGTNKAMYMNFYNYDNQGAQDYLITPVIDLTTATQGSLTFNYAYSYYQGSNDRMRVLVTSTCNFSTTPVEVFNKAGSSLATTTASTTEFVPTASQWSTATIVLNQFFGQKIQIAFEGINDYGNNLYIDNVSITNVPINSLTVNKIVSPSPVSCQSSVAPVINFTNSGNTIINSLVADLYVNGTHTSETLSSLQMVPGATSSLSFSAKNFSSGNNTFSVSVNIINGVANTAAKDSIFSNLVINRSTDVIPLRENFDDNFVSAWSIVSPSGGQIWSPTSTNKSTSLAFNSFTNTALGEQTYLASPVLDFSETSQASVFFETSYAYRSFGSESLQVYSSSDCGETFDKLVFSSSGIALANSITSDVAWAPTKSTDWVKNYINLDSLAGKKNVRLAFVATNGNGNNLYLDNVEFFTSDNSAPIAISNLYSIYGGLSDPVKITFNLPDRQTVRVQAYDMLGHIASDNLLSETLNQTYTIDFPTGSNGLYIIRVQTATTTTATKVLIGF